MFSKAYPFTAIVKQDRLKRALLLNLIDPRIGGVLISGQKGTGKSTIVRSLADLSEKKVITLPLNATEDMLVGGIDFVKTLGAKETVFMPGVFSRCHGEILYVDEINLLNDSLSQIIVTTLAAGENIVEREGISYSHPSEFILIGTMNPEEGGLRPQLLDKFGLFVNVEGEEDVEIRTEIIKRRISFEENPNKFLSEYHDREEKLKHLLKEAQIVHQKLVVSEPMRRLASVFANKANVEGNRAEILLIRTAAAIAALDLRSYLTASDIKEACEFVLPHRRRNVDQNNQQEEQSNENREKETKPQDDSKSPGVDIEEDSNQTRTGDEEELEIDSQESTIEDQSQTIKEDLVYGEEIYETKPLPTGFRDRLKRKGTGHRKKTYSSVNKGRYAGFTISNENGERDIALDATLRAAAVKQYDRPKNGMAITIRDDDLRYKKRENKLGLTIVFVVDASGSMGAKKRMKETKEAIMSLLMDSYQKRDKVGLVAFRKNDAEVLLPITSSVDLASKELQELPTGGRTPLAKGIHKAWELLVARKRKDPDMMPLLVLVTDGRANSGILGDPVEDALSSADLIRNSKIPAVVIDTENDFLSFQLAKKISLRMNADYFKVYDLKSSKMRNVVSFYRKES